MTVSALLPGVPVAVPLAGAALLAGLRRWLSRRAADALGILFATLTLLASSALLADAVTHGASVSWFGNWYPRGTMVLGIGFVLEPIGTGLATLAALLTLLAIIFSWRFVDAGGLHFQPLMLIFLAAMSGFALTGDLFNLFVFFELMSTAAFALCGLKTAEPAPLQGTFNFAVTNTIAAFLVLTGIAMLYAVTGALNMAQIGLALGPRHDPLVLFAFTLLTCGFLIKAAIVPFHLWLPDAHAVAPTSVCVLFSGIMVELGLYAVVRLHSVLFAQSLEPHASAVRLLLLVFGGVTVILGGLMCYAEHHLKRMLAFSTICHAGLMLVSFAIGGPVAIAAMLTYLLAHAFIKASLFFVSGIILHRLRSVTERTLFGKGRGMPWIAILWFVGGAGLAAAPPFALMWGEAGAEHAAKLAGVHGLWVLFLFGGMFTSAAVFRVGMHTFFGWGDEPLTDSAAEVGELPETGPENQQLFPYHVIPPAVCIAMVLFLGLWHGWLPVLANASAALGNQHAYIRTVYSAPTVTPAQSLWSDAIAGTAARSSIAVVLAFAFACTSVFRTGLKARLRLGVSVERDLSWLRALQSGHPGDYVVWITIGLAIFGTVSMVLLR